MPKLEESLEKFALENKMVEKGALCVALVVTRHAAKMGLPLNPGKLLTPGKGQVLGLGKGAVQSILAEYKIKTVLAEEGGRTSRGSVGNMQAYVKFLNTKAGASDFNLKAIEKWWVGKVKQLWERKPFVLSFDSSKSLRAIVHHLIDQAQKRQRASGGTMFVGTMLQHLVGAKLDVLLQRKLAHHGASVADQSSDRDADFLLNDVAIHVTSSPSEALMRKCVRNLESGHRPIVLTLGKGVQVADGLAESASISDRIDIFDTAQFLAGNLYELGKFEAAGRKATALKIIERYNEIIEECENDPSLRIELGK